MTINEPIAIDLTRITKANFDISERLFNEGVSLSYDEDADTLFVNIGEPKPTLSKPFIDGIYIQIEPSDYKIMGCTILAFASDFLGKNKLIRKMFPNAIVALKSSNGSLKLSGTEAEKTKIFFQNVLSR